MAWVKRVKYFDAIGAIEAIRNDWAGEDLLRTEAPVGLVLADLAHYLQLDQGETEQALGAELAGKLKVKGVL